MAKIITEILPGILPVAGSTDIDSKRDRYLHTFTAPHQQPRNSWTSYYGSVPDDVTRQIWKVPTGVSTAKFELWGAGGGGAVGNARTGAHRARLD